MPHDEGTPAPPLGGSQPTPDLAAVIFRARDEWCQTGTAPPSLSEHVAAAVLAALEGCAVIDGRVMRLTYVRQATPPLWLVDPTTGDPE